MTIPKMGEIEDIRPRMSSVEDVRPRAGLVEDTKPKMAVSQGMAETIYTADGIGQARGLLLLFTYVKRI